MYLKTAIKSISTGLLAGLIIISSTNVHAYRQQPSTMCTIEFDLNDEYKGQTKESIEAAFTEQASKRNLMLKSQSPNVLIFESAFKNMGFSKTFWTSMSQSSLQNGQSNFKTMDRLVINIYQFKPETITVNITAQQVNNPGTPAENSIPGPCNPGDSANIKAGITALLPKVEAPTESTETNNP